MERRYALDLASPVSFVATALEAAAPAAVSLSDLARSYQHINSSDYHRIKIHEGCANDVEAKRWLVRAAVAELGKHVATDGDEYTLVSPFDKIRVDRRRIYRYVESDPEVDQPRAIKAAYYKLKEALPVTIKEVNARGTVKDHYLRLHPLATVFPPLSEKEFTKLVETVRKNGFLFAIHTLDDMILDGRHRAVISDLLNIPLRVEQFTGDEDSAKSFVYLANVARRHLTKAQAAQINIDLHYEDAKAIAAEHQREGNAEGGRGGKSTASSTVDFPAEPEPEKRGKTAAEIVAERSEGETTAADVKKMLRIQDAPETREKVNSGAIKTPDAAVTAGLIETGKDEPAKLPTKLTHSHWSILGQVSYRLRAVIEAQQAGMDLGGHSTDDYRKRLAEIRALLDEYEAGL